MGEFELHHIGEPLVAGMLDELTAAGRLDTIAVWRLKADVTSETTRVDFERVQSLDKQLASAPRFLPECSFSSGSLAFDAESKIDLAMTDNETVMPWEIKLGTTGLSRGDLLKKQCTGSTRRANPSNLVKGKMISILQDWACGSGAFEGTEDLHAIVNGVARPMLLERRWGLVLRQAVFDALRSSKPIGRSNDKSKFGLLRTGVYVMTFEDIVRAVTFERFLERTRALVESSVARLAGELAHLREATSDGRAR